jgi:hypothetical protein
MSNNPREHPLILRDWQVRAVLDGRMTMVRTPIKLPPGWSKLDSINPLLFWVSHDQRGNSFWQLGDDRISPNCHVGDRLWCQECWCRLLHTSPASDEPLELTNGDRLIEPATFWVDEQGRKRWHYDGLVIAYRATTDIEFCDGDGFSGESANRDDMPRWRSSATMPRKFSRIDLDVTAVRVERLQEITSEGANSEGCPEILGGEYCVDGMQSHVVWFMDRWNSRYPKFPFDTNPWVLVREFKCVDSAGHARRRI